MFIEPRPVNPIILPNNGKQPEEVQSDAQNSQNWIHKCGQKNWIISLDDVNLQKIKVLNTCISILVLRDTLYLMPTFEYYLLGRNGVKLPVFFDAKCLAIFRSYSTITQPQKKWRGQKNYGYDAHHRIMRVTRLRWYGHVVHNYEGPKCPCIINQKTTRQSFYR